MGLHEGVINIRFFVCVFIIYGFYFFLFMNFEGKKIRVSSKRKLEISSGTRTADHWTPYWIWLYLHFLAVLFESQLTTSSFLARNVDRH